MQSIKGQWLGRIEGTNTGSMTINLDERKHDREIAGVDVVAVADRLELLGRTRHTTLSADRTEEVIAIAIEARSIHARRTELTHAHPTPLEASEREGWRLVRVRRRDQTFSLEDVAVLSDRCDKVFIRVVQLIEKIEADDDEGERA